MRLAVLADIHGNLAALEAVIADIAERRAESGSPAARYAIVEIDDTGPDHARFELLSIPYDHQAAVRRALACDRADWAGVLSSGYADVR